MWHRYDRNGARTHTYPYYWLRSHHILKVGHVIRFCFLFVYQEKFKATMDQVEKYSALYNLPRKLEEAIKLFYTFQYKKKVGADEEVHT